MSLFHHSSVITGWRLISRNSLLMRLTRPGIWILRILYLLVFIQRVLFGLQSWFKFLLAHKSLLYRTARNISTPVEADQSAVGPGNRPLPFFAYHFFIHPCTSSSLGHYIILST